MDMDNIIRHFREWYGPQEGMKVYLTVIPGIMADFNRMLDCRPGEMVSEAYKLEDGKGTIILSGRKKKDGTVRVSAECRAAV